MIAALVHFDVDVSVQDSAGRTPLMVACEKGNSEVAMQLLELSHEPDACDHFVCQRIISINDVGKYGFYRGMFILQLGSGAYVHDKRSRYQSHVRFC